MKSWWDCGYATTSYLVRQVIMAVLIISPWSLSYADAYYGDLYNVFFLDNDDGDTIMVNIPEIHPLIGKNISVRIRGIDTPEINARCESEKMIALKAKIFVHDILASANKIIFMKVGRDKYFRILANVYADGKDISQLLLEAGLAVLYDGRKKRLRWCYDSTNMKEE